MRKYISFLLIILSIAGSLVHVSAADEQVNISAEASTKDAALTEIMQGLSSLMEGDFFKLIEIIPIKEDNMGIRLIYKAASMSNAMGFVNLLSQSPLFKDIKIEYVTKKNNSFMSEITFYISENAYYLEARKQELEIIKKKFINSEFESFQE